MLRMGIFVMVCKLLEVYENVIKFKGVWVLSHFLSINIGRIEVQIKTQNTEIFWASGTKRNVSSVRNWILDSSWTCSVTVVYIHCIIIFLLDSILIGIDIKSGFYILYTVITSTMFVCNIQHWNHMSIIIYLLLFTDFALGFWTVFFYFILNLSIINRCKVVWECITISRNIQF